MNLYKNAILFGTTSLRFNNQTKSKINHFRTIHSNGRPTHNASKSKREADREANDVQATTYFPYAPVMEAQPQKPVKLDGRVGEGGGQLLRVAISLAAITGRPVRIDNIRANRERGGSGGGLKAQHATCVKCLQDATRAEVTGLSVGSKSVEFKAKLSPAELVNRNIWIKADSAASILLVFQALLPFLLFAGDDKGSPVTVVIQGGTNVSFSLSFEYLDQVLLPSLERFGVEVERKLESRGWSHGSRQIGSAKFKLTPLAPGKSLTAPEWPSEQGSLKRIDISIIVPQALQDPLRKSLLFELDTVFPGVEPNFLLVEDSKHNARMYTLIVAHTSTGLRFGRDWLYDKKAKGKSEDDLATEIAQKVVDELDAEIRKGGLVDEYLQDQLIVFQALADGKTSIPGSKDIAASDRERVERMDEPFGDGSTHTTTARWVTGQLLPHVKWIDKGRICEGVGWKTASEDELISKNIEGVHLT